MSQCDTKIDLKIHVDVGHSDLYFMVLCDLECFMDERHTFKSLG